MPPEKPESHNEHEEMQELLEENKRLLTENNEMLHKMRRQMVWELWLRVAWYVILIGLPFALYFYVLEPYFTALGSSYDTFNAGIQEIPGWKQLNEVFKNSFMDGSQ